MMRTALVVLIVAVPAFARAAHADVIDGTWCRLGGQRLSIDGPSIVTPGGNALRGNYGRHSFDYAIPAGEPQAGTTMRLRLLNEQTMQSRGGDAAAAETWQRCTPPVS